MNGRRQLAHHLNSAGDLPMVSPLIFNATKAADLRSRCLTGHDLTHHNSHVRLTEGAPSTTSDSAFYLYANRPY